ncbi:MAG TPA: glycerate kinase [Terriglobales bacterium]|nr:glycerate kinase [Terriglobales bacterium]
MSRDGDRLRVLFAPDSFKGSLSSVEVARALAEGWARARSADELILAPLADGGEGTLAAIAETGGWEWQECASHDPLGRPLTSNWLLSADGRRAAVEMAEASGLSRLPDGEPRSPLAATTEGTGEVLAAVLDAGVRHVLLGVGGSATTDGGAGLLGALGASYRGSSESPLPGPITDLSAVDLAGLDPRLRELELRIACDVTNPLLGEHGAAATYAPQKGAWPEDVVALEAWLTHFADLLEEAAGTRARNTPGAGAAGGTSFGLLCMAPRMRSFELVPGIDVVMEETGFAERLMGVDLVITGEGRIDEQTAYGKTALGVARRAAAAGVPCLAVGGGITPEGVAALAKVGAVAVPMTDGPMTLEEAISEAAILVAAAGQRLARVMELGTAVGERRSARLAARIAGS